jgi:hypothetical protein
VNTTTPDTLAHLLEATTTATLRTCLAENPRPPTTPLFTACGTTRK